VAALTNLGVLYLRASNDLDRAESYLVEAQTIYDRFRGSNPLQYTSTLFALSYLHIRRSQFADAERALRRILPVVNEQEGEDAKFYVKLLGFLAIALKGQGRHEEALAVVQREMEGQQRLIRRVFSFATEE